MPTEPVEPLRSQSLDHSQGAAPGETTGTKGIRNSRRRRWAFRIFFLLLPVLVLGGAELICRLAGRGGYPPVIRHVGSDGSREWYSTYRPGVDSFFYTNLSHTGGMRTINFVTPKPANTVRILMLGGSAMQGYPHPLPLTNGSFLEAMLTDAWGDERRAEVLNLGATAMASFPAACFLEEMIDHQVDLVIIMTGNNEFYGAYGVASLHTAGTTPTGMRLARWLRGLGLTQWLADVFAKPPDVESVRNQPLMQRVAVNQHVGPDDPLRGRARSTLAANLTQMVDRCVRRKIPVMVCTLPTNERDMAPIGEDPQPRLESDEANRYRALIERASGGDDPAASVEHLTAAIALYDRGAKPHYLLGQAHVRLGDDAKALDSFIRARDLDTMPWRATSPANDAAKSMASRGAIVCDMEAAMRNASPHGAIGWELMCDHVHMSLRGQALFAEVIAGELARLPEPLRVDPERLAALPDWSHYAQRLGANLYNDYVLASRMKTLFDIPFLQSSNPAAHQKFTTLCADLQAQMSERDREAVTQWHDPGLHLSNHRPLTFVVGYYRMMDGDYATAEQLFDNARASLAHASFWRLQLTWYMLKCRRGAGTAWDDRDDQLVRDAVEVGALLDRFVGFRTPLDPAYLGMVYNVAGDHARAIALLDDAVRYAKGAEGWDMVRALADSLVRTGAVDRARLLLTLAQKDEIMAPAARALLAQLDSVSRPGGDP